MKILVAVDSFKGSLTSIEVADAIEEGIKRAIPCAEVDKMPIADGGEGTTEALVIGTGGDIHKTLVTGPLGDKREAILGILGDKKTCVLEMASASGITLISKEDRNPMKTTTYGTGELILKGLDLGCRDFIIGIGGSATNDGGVGMAQALGIRFLDKHGETIGYGGETLTNIHDIDLTKIDPRIAESTFKVACDVDNPLCGERGATRIYGPQKGATEDMMVHLDKGLYNLARVIKDRMGKDILEIEGAGAAGGLGGGLVAFCNGQLLRGIEIVMTALDMEESIKEVDLVITGEGRIDYQTAMGKAPVGIAELAKQYSKPVIALCGSIGEKADENHNSGIDAIFSIINEPMTLETAMITGVSKALVIQTTEEIFRLIKVSKYIG